MKHRGVMEFYIPIHVAKNFVECQEPYVRFNVGDKFMVSLDQEEARDVWAIIASYFKGRVDDTKN